MLSVENITKTYKGGLKAVDDLSFTLKGGKVLGILGPNGAGKTTTIRMILNIIKPDSGAIYFNGEHISDATKNFIGYLPEERGLYKKSTIGDTLYYFATLKNLTGTNVRKTINQWLDRFELGGMYRRKVEELSKGNQQKIQFIAAILHNPELLILDEPFSGLDPVNQIKFKDVALSLRDEGKAIIFCTHQMEAAEKICDNIVLVNKGKAAVTGSVDDVKKQFAGNIINLEFEGSGSFISSLPMVEYAEVYPNFAEVRLAKDANLNDFIPHLLPHLQIRKIEKAQPSLHSIFIDVVGKENLSHDFINQAKEARL